VRQFGNNPCVLINLAISSIFLGMQRPTRNGTCSEKRFEEYSIWTGESPEPLVEHLDRHVTLSKACRLCSSDATLPRCDVRMLKKWGIEPTGNSYKDAAKSLYWAIQANLINT